jgi:hypothetical protein
MSNLWLELMIIENLEPHHTMLILYMLALESLPNLSLQVTITLSCVFDSFTEI